MGSTIKQHRPTRRIQTITEKEHQKATSHSSQQNNAVDPDRKKVNGV
jgi:hypothetical protein